MAPAASAVEVMSSPRRESFRFRMTWIADSIGSLSAYSITSSARMEAEAMFVLRRPPDIIISPFPVALVEGRRRARWYPPGTTDTLGARKAKVLHQVNQVVAQSKIRRHRVNRFYARHFDLRQACCRGFGRPHGRHLLLLSCRQACRSHACEPVDELGTPT